MTPESKLKEGRLEEALAILTAEVRSNPADAKRRVFLFQLLSLMGQWERAGDQLRVCGELDALNLMMAGAYRQVLVAERQRAQVFEGRGSPTVIGEPEQWLALMLQALRLDTQGQHVQAVPLRDLAFEQAPSAAGSIDGVPFEWIADADPRFGPCLEIMVEGGYSWVPFSRLRELKFEAPSDLRDKVWTPVQVTWATSGQTVGFVPSRYPGSERSQDPDVILGRRTDWVSAADNVYLGSGQRMLATDAGEYPLLEVRHISFNLA